MAAALASIPVTDGGRDYRTAKIVAVIAGLLGALLAIATPFLPVEQTTAKLNWPQNAVLDSVTAPLISYVATDLDIDIPCSAAAGLTGPGRTVLLSTVPKQAPKAVDRGLLIERVNNNLAVIVRNTPVLVAPLSAVLSPACEKLTFTAHAYMVRALASTAQRAKLRAQFLQDGQDAWEESERTGTVYYHEDARAYFQAHAAWRRGEGPEPVKPGK